MILYNRVFRFWAALFVLASLGCSEKSDLRIDNLVVREMPPGSEVGVAYLTIENMSSESLILNYVHSPRTDVIEVHQHLYENGLMQMREVKHLTIDPNTRVEFKPGGYHLMLFGVDSRFEAGQELELTFEFENKAPVTVTAAVRRL